MGKCSNAWKNYCQKCLENITITIEEVTLYLIQN